MTNRVLPAQMEAFRSEVWREDTMVKDTYYGGPLTGEEALGALRTENPQWTGKLTTKDSQVGLRGPTKLDSSKTYVLRLTAHADLSKPIWYEHRAMADAMCPYARWVILLQWARCSRRPCRWFHWADSSCASRWILRALARGQLWRRPGGKRYYRNPAQPLLINGFTKAGKSFVLADILPAVLADVPALREQGPFLLRLDCSDIPVQHGSAGLLAWLLKNVMYQMYIANVPIPEFVWQRAADAARGHDHAFIIYMYLEELLAACQELTIVMIDETQNLLMPRGPDGKIDSVTYMRDVVFKFLLTRTQPNMTCVITGSSLVLAWLSIAEMPPNGVCAMTSCIPLYLPSTFWADHMAAIWADLVQQGGLIPEVLRDICPRRPACLVMMSEEYSGEVDAATFASEWIYTKLVAESRQEWNQALLLLTKDQALAVLQLSSVLSGLNATGTLGPGLQRSFNRYLRQKPGSNSYFLDSPEQRQLLQLTISKDGHIRTDWPGLGIHESLVKLEAAKLVRQSGELITRMQGKYDLAAGGEFMEKIKAIADQIDSKLSWQKWHSCEWFLRAAAHPRKEASAAGPDTSEPGHATRDVAVVCMSSCLGCSLHELVGLLQDAISPLDAPDDAPDDTIAAEASNPQPPSASAAASCGTPDAARQSLLVTPRQRLVQHRLSALGNPRTRPLQRPCAHPVRTSKLKQYLIASQQLQRVLT
ncbi:hypothetical protein WJX74_008476 [Apatococcus lobatus]|uniref:Uncharacterized protein n=1 Tax=Apatococcus lobatus TaxID=904363 RepID=A0AAW1QH96_9CHLO